MPVGAQPPANDDLFGGDFAPPKDESPEERASRLEREQAERRTSDAIDEEINRARRVKKKPIKLLLLGQSESGKSTTIKNFQLLYATREFREQRSSWKAVIFLNVVQSVLLILDAILEAEKPRRPSSPGPNSPTRQHARSPTLLNEDHQAILKRLESLEEVEKKLLSRLAINGENEATRLSEFAVCASSKWKTAVSSFIRTERRSMDSHDSRATEKERERIIVNENELLNEVASSLIEARSDIESLWNDPLIRALQPVLKLRLDEKPGYFLDCLNRVAAPGYVPSDDDVLKARLKTLGVSEYPFKLDTRYPVQPDWRVFDVGGARSQRQYWAPYFDDMDAIIFLVPLSCFDQVLAEDEEVNRLEDCFHLWQQVCSNKLLAKCPLILFFNKRDILERKLNSGVVFAKYVRSYEDANEATPVTRYLKRKFEANQREFSPVTRQFFSYTTSMTDSRHSSGILASMTDMVMRQNLQKIALL